MDSTWLKGIFADAGLPPEVAERAGRASLRRLLEHRGTSAPTAAGRSILDALVTDPELSVRRIVQRGHVGLPFHDPDTGRLAVAAIADVLIDVDEDPVPAMAFARLIAEAVEPEAWYGPLWSALGEAGPFDLDALARLDLAARRPGSSPGDASEGRPGATRRRAPVRKPSVSVRPPPRRPSSDD